MKSLRTLLFFLLAWTAAADGPVKATQITNTGTLTQTGATIVPTAAMTVSHQFNTGKLDQTETLSANTTFTLSGTPASGTRFCFTLTANSGGPWVVTLPAGTWVSDALGSTRTTFTVPASTTIHCQVIYSGTTYYLFGEPVGFSDLPANTTPAITDLFQIQNPTTGVNSKSTLTQVFAAAAGSITGVPMFNGVGAASVAKANEIEASLYAADAGSNDTYVVSLSPAISSYFTGAHYRFKANTANTGSATININSVGMKTIKKVVGGITTDLADNDIRAGQWVDIVYDGTNMQMQSTLGNAASSGAPVGATYITETADGTLTNEFAMGSLATGFTKNTTTTGVPSVAVPGTGVETWFTTPTPANFFAATPLTDSSLALATKPASTVVATANLTLSGEQTIDGVTTSGSTVLATAQSTGSQNGPWITAAGAWARPGYYTAGSTTQAPQFLTVFVRLGSIYQGSTWRMTTASVTIDTTATTWARSTDGIGAETDVASATTTDLGAVGSRHVRITGTTTITGFGTAAAGTDVWGAFNGVLTLTYNATSMKLNTGGQSVTTAVDDTFHALSLGSGNWRVQGFRADGTPWSLGTLNAGTNPGAITAFDMTVTSASPAGTEQSIGFNVDGVNLFKIYSEADGAGGIQNAQMKFKGTPTNDAAATGYVGEYVSSSIVIGSATSLTTATAKNVTTISLTAGDWDVGGMVSFSETTSTVTARVAGISTTTATLPTDGTEGYCGVQSTVTSETNSIPLTRQRVSLSATTTVYLVAKATFSAGTAAGFGTINARRVR